MDDGALDPASRHRHGSQPRRDLPFYWLVALASGPEAFGTAQAIAGSVIGQIVLFGVTFSVFYHLCNGIRHLFWDMGKGFELKTAQASAYTVVAVAVVLTILSWILAYSMGGA